MLPKSSTPRSLLRIPLTRESTISREYRFTTQIVPKVVPAMRIHKDVSRRALHKGPLITNPCEGQSANPKIDLLAQNLKHESRRAIFKSGSKYQNALSGIS